MSRFLHHLRERFASLPLGAAPLLILAMALGSALILSWHPVQQSDADLTMWIFSANNYDSYRPALPAFEAAHELDVDLQLVNFRAVNQRLRSALWAEVNVPDLVEIEAGHAGGFFRGPVDQVGFIDLRPYLEANKLMERIPASSLASYTDRGRIRGLPHDIHPVLLAYRADLLEPLLTEHGMSVDDLTTWEDFCAFGRMITRPGERYLLQMDDSSAWAFNIFFMQRGGNYFDAEGELIMDGPIAEETLLWMIPLVTGDHPNRVAANLGNWGSPFMQGLIEGYYLTALCPDWRSTKIQRGCGELAGKLKLMPLPAVEPGGLRTSQSGGTMLAITRACPQPEVAWTLAQKLYFGDPARAGELFRKSNILTPDRAAWSDPAFHEPRPYWSGQIIGELYIAQADATPTVNPSSFRPLAETKMSEVVVACRSYYLTHGEVGFAEFVREQLRSAADMVRAQMARDPDWDGN